MEYAPPPTSAQLAAVGRDLGVRLAFRERIVGGLGCTTDVLETVDGDRLILRRHGPWWEQRGVDIVARERHVLDLVGAGGLPVPRPVWAAKGVFHEPAIVIEFLKGRPDLDPVDPLGRAEQLAAALTTLHAVDVDDETAAVLPEGSPEVAGEDDGRFEAHPAGLRIRRRLAELRASAGSVAPTVIHGDFWPGNILWHEGALSGVVDWEEAAVADPIADLAYCAVDLRYVGLADAADHLVVTYAGYTGRSLRTLDLWTLAALCRPLPDIAQWLPAWRGLGLKRLGVDELRTRHAQLIEQALAST